MHCLLQECFTHAAETVFYNRANVPQHPTKYPKEERFCMGELTLLWRRMLHPGSSWVLSTKDMMLT